MKKKMITALLASAMVLSLVACGGGGTDSNGGGDTSSSGSGTSSSYGHGTRTLTSRQ